MKIETCPVCKETSAQTLYGGISVDQNEYDLVECNNCSHYYTKFHNEIDIESYYNDKDYSVRDTRRSIFFRIQKLEYQRVVKKIRKFTSGHRLLDFGSGKGIFLSLARSEFTNVAGIETSGPRAEYAKSVFGLNVSTDFYTEGRVDNEEFDVITMFHVLEHIPEAKKLLQNLYSQNLSKSGVAVIEVPNFSSWQARWAKRHWLHIDIPRHISHFTDLNLEKLVNELDYKIVARQTFSWHLGIVGMTQSLMNLLGYRGFLIGDLKSKKNKAALLAVPLILPVAFVAELISTLFNRGGVIRYYLKRNKH